jgi:hypothetical protein
LIAALQRLDANARIVGTGGQLYPCVGAMFGFDDARPHDPMADARYVELLTKTVGWDPKNYYAKWNDTDTLLLDELGVKYVVTEPGRELKPSRYRLLYSGRDGRIYENRTAKERFFSGEASVEIVRSTPDAYVLRVRAEHPSVVASGILHDPDWHVSGARRVRWKGVFLGLVAPAGTHEIQVRYRPLAFYAASGISLLTLAMLPVLFRKRRADRLR